MSSKNPSIPRWWKNTFYWFGIALVLLALWGLVKGDSVIRDPGQTPESVSLVLLYFVAGVLMLVNGHMTHAQAVQQYSELVDDEPEAKESPLVDVSEAKSE